jgi:hypothetical protein
VLNAYSVAQALARHGAYAPLWCELQRTGRVVSMDEVGFGPRREPRRPSRRLRAFAAAVAIASAAAAGVAFAVTAAAEHHAITSLPPALHPAALPAPLIRPPSAVCPPVHAAWPDLADLPAGMRTGALPIVIDEQFSGECSVP